MEVATILSLVSTAAIVGGLIFAGFQVRIAQRERTRDAQLRLAGNTFFNPGFLRGVRVVLDLPDGLTKAEMTAHLGGDMSEIDSWLGSMEGLGFLVFRRALPLDIVDASGGPIILSWRKLEGYVREERAKTGREPMWEWFQWLAERLIEYESRTSRSPAQVEHRDWRP